VFDKLFKDPTLLLRLKRGDEGAYDEWFLQITALLHAYFRRWKVRPEQLPDLAATVLAELWESRFKDYDPQRGSPGAFVALIAKRVALDHRRAEKKTEALPLDDFNELTYEICMPGTDEDGEDRATRLDSALKPLQRRERSMLLRKFEGETTTQLSRRFRISESAVKSKLRRIVKKLQRIHQVKSGGNFDP